MKRILAAALFTAGLLPTVAMAQSTPNANVVAACGAASYTAGTARPVTQDTTGTQCTAGSSSTSPTSVTAAPLTPLAAQQTLTLSGTAQALTIPATATTIDMMPEGTAGTNNACLRYRDDGTNPTAAVGFPLAPLQGVFGYKVTSLPIKFINATGATCTVTINFYK